MRTKRLQKNLIDTRKGLYEDLKPMFQVKAHTTKSIIESTRHKFPGTVERSQGLGRGQQTTRPDVGAAKPLNFDRTT
jgi:hypothetical protein